MLRAKPLVVTAGLSDEQIGAMFNIHQSTVHRILRRHTKIKGFYYVKPKSGRPRNFFPRDVCVAFRMLGNNQAHDIVDLQRLRFPDVAADPQKTCRLRTEGLHTS